MSNFYTVTRFMRPLLGVIGLLFLSFHFAFGQATINPGGNPTDTRIIQRLTGTGLGITNPTLERGNRNVQIATFTNGFAAGFGIDQGVLFSTGNATQDLQNRNNQLSISNNPGNSGADPHLTAIVSNATFNTVSYSFDITLQPEVNGIRIVFQFGSEEYPDYVGSSYNDVFGFFVSGP